MTSKIGSKDSYSFSQTKTETKTYYVNNGLCIAFCAFPWGRDPRTRTLDMDGMRHRRSRRVVGLLGLWISQYGALWILYDICHNSPCTAIPFNTSWKIQWLGLYNQSKLNVKEKPFFRSIQFSWSLLMITHATGVTAVSPIEKTATWKSGHRARPIRSH